MKKTRKVTEMGRLITRGEYVANVKANNERIVQALRQFDAQWEARIRRVEAVLKLPEIADERTLAIVKDEPGVPA